MLYLNPLQYLLLCIVATAALLAHTIWPSSRDDRWQRWAWTLSVLGWGFIAGRLWFAVGEMDRSITAVGAVGMTLLAAGAVIRRFSSGAR